MKLYMDYLDILKNTLSFFTFIYKRSHTDDILERFDEIIGLQFKILKNCPQHGHSIRKDILHMIKYEVSEIYNIEKTDQNRGFHNRDEIYRRRNETLSKHLDDFFDLNIIFGQGKISKELQFFGRSLIVTIISQYREPSMNQVQLKKCLQTIIKIILDPSIVISMRSTFIFFFHRKYLELYQQSVQEQSINPHCELQLEVLEALVLLMKDLDPQIRIATNEMLTFKEQVSELRKKNKRWMTDMEQRDINFKELFLQDDYQFYEVGKSDPIDDIEKIKTQFMFHTFFDTVSQGSTVQSQEINRERQKYQSFLSLTDLQLTEYLDQQKENTLRLIRNTTAMIDTVIVNIQEIRRTKCLRLQEMKLLRKLLIHGSHIIQSLQDMYPQEKDKDKINDVIKRFAKIFQQMRVLQFRDLFNSVEDEFFGYVVEIKATKGDIGVYLFAEYLMSFQQLPQPGQQPHPVNKHLDDQTAYILEIFFNYINVKMRVFNKAMENEKMLSMNSINQLFAKIPTPDLQDALQKLTLSIGAKALSKRSDLRMKNLFFSVFVYCIKYTKSSQIIPYYYSVIRNLFKELNLTTIGENTSSSSSNFVKEFIPLMQGLLETFLQAREEAPFIKETNEICYSVPAKLKNLIEYLPIISRPLIDSMKSSNIELIESGINMIQIWVSALGNYPEILDPVIDNIIPDLNSLLYKILYLFPNYSFKLLGKFGAKSRMYHEDKEFKSKNFPEDGLKIDLEDKNSGKQISLGIDAAIDVILLKIFDSFHKFNHAKLLEAYRLIKGAFICFIEPIMDKDYVIASIHNAKLKNTELLTEYNMNNIKFFDTKKTQIKVSYLGKASESHAFEKILKCLLICRSLPKSNPETQEIHKKVKKFFKWVTEYFTLVYICKNGKLRENLVNEISPMLFLENICDFLYYNMIEGMPKTQNRTYHKGSISALKTMIRIVKDFYGDEDEKVYENLEFIQFIVQKVCHLAYGHDIHKKIAANKALQIIIQELPKRTIKMHWQTLVDSIFHILNTNNEPLNYQVERECKATLDSLFEKLGAYAPNLLDSMDEEEKEFNLKLLDRILINLMHVKVSSRTVTVHFIEKISKKSGCKVKQILTRVTCNNYINILLQQQQQLQQQQLQQQQQQLQQQQQQQQQQQAAGGAVQPQQQPPAQLPRPPPITAAQIIASNDVSWQAYLIFNQVESRAKNIYSLFKGGYSQILNLMTYLDLIEFLMKHEVLEPMKKVHAYLLICEQLIKVLEDEIEKSEPPKQRDPISGQPIPPGGRDPQNFPSGGGSAMDYPAGSANSLANDPKISNSGKAAIKYMISEKQYLIQNKTYDPYSHTIHTHQVLQTQHFEVEEAAKRDKILKETQEYYESNNASYVFFEIFEKKFDQVNPKAYQTFNPQEYNQFSTGLKLRINDFISRLFSPLIKASDISFEYVHHMYEIFPNHRLHTELIAKCLHVLSELSTTQEDMYKFFKERQQAFFDQQNIQPQQPQQPGQPFDGQTDASSQASQPAINSHLNRKIDLYAVEIKSRMIAIYFKFFQREEQNIYRQAKRCLKKLLRRETNQQEALPNLILKECVRPSLNILSLRGSFPALYEQLAKLIYVLHGCFNDQLGRHLIKCYEQNKGKITEDFVFSFSRQNDMPPGQGSNQDNQYPPQNAPIPPYQADPSIPIEQQEQYKQMKFKEDYERLLTQQNQKIEELEIANHIIRILYLLPTSRQEILRILMQIPDFEFKVLFDLERKFEDAYTRLLDHYQMSYIFPHEQSIRPISIRLGILKSDFRVGLARYYNKVPLEAVGSFQNLTLMPVMLDIMKEPSSFCLRERVSREFEVIRQFVSYDVESTNFDMGLNLICIFLKYNRNYLSLINNYGIVDKLQEKWNELGNFNADKLLQKSGGVNQFRNQSHLREIYTKIQTCLLTYCRHPNAKLSVIFNLIRGYRYQSIVDMSPTKLFFMYEVPYNFSLQKKRILLDQTLKEIQAGQHTEVQKFMIFELAFMPSIIMHSIKGSDQQQQPFKELVNEKMMQDFVETFFGVKLVETANGSQRVQQLECLRQNLEISMMVSYEQFQIEIIKVINLMFRYFDFITIQKTCGQSEVQKISQFLYNCSKKANNPALKEWAFYTLTSLFVMILDACQYEQRMNQPIQSADSQMIQMITQSTDQVLMMIMQHSQTLNMKALVHKSFRNIMNIFSDAKIKEMLPSVQNSANNQIDYVSLCLKRALIFEGRNSQSLIYLSSFLLGHSEQFYYTHEQFYGRMNKIIQRFCSQYTPNIVQKQLIVEISSVIITWISQRVMQQPRQGPLTDLHVQNYQIIFRNVLYFLIRTSIIITFSQNEPIKEVLDLSNYCLQQIKNLVRVFPNVRIEFPYFNRLLQQEGGDRENIQLIKMAVLNVSYILIKYQKHVNEFKTFFLDFIVPTVTKLKRGIPTACKIILHIISTRTDPQLPSQMPQINQKLKQYIQNDLSKSSEEAIALVLQKTNEIEQRYNIEQKSFMLACQEVGQLMFSVIPHFTIRLITTIDSSFKTQGTTLQERNVQYCDDEFKFLKELATILFRIVGQFRKIMIFDQSEINPTKMRIKHNVVFQTTNAQTQFSQPIEFYPNSVAEDIIELKVEDINYDIFNKESIMIGVHYVVKRMKKMPNEQSIQLLENVLYIILTLVKFNTNEYMIEWFRKIVDVLIDDDPEDASKLIMEQKASYITKILQKIADIQIPERKDSVPTNLLIEAIYEQTIRFLEKQTTFLNDHTLKLFEKVFLNLKGKSRPLKERVFALFEKLQGASLFKKMQFFFNKHQLEDNEKTQFYQSQSQLLDFTLYNFRTDTKLTKTKYSSRLFPLYNLSLKFEKDLDFEQTQIQNENSEYQRLSGQLENFSQKIKKYSQLTLKSIMDPISEIISINPSHSTDKNISDKLLVKLFYQFWGIQTREEQQVLTELINSFIVGIIPMINQNDFRKNLFPKTFLESIATLSPQIRVEPEILQYIGKNLNLWHVTIPILENHITVYPSNERYIFSLNEMYQRLAEEDYIAGLRRLVTDAKETRTAISYGQHQMWEELNQQFNQFIIYHAEEQGLYLKMDKEVDILGKYQRQMQLSTYKHLKDNHKEAYKKHLIDRAQAQGQVPDEQAINQQAEQEEMKLEESINRFALSSQQLSQQKPRLNTSRFKEMDLSIWNNLFIESLKVLNKWDQYRDIAHALQNQEMLIETYWNVKDWRNLALYEDILKKSESIKYQIYYIYYIIYQQYIHQFDEMFKQVIHLSFKEWDQYLPNYIDNIQFENLIMFQLVMETSEGGRNLIKEAPNMRSKNKLSDLKSAINIWRERIPNKCESINMWKEVLENRNFIQLQISSIICPTQPQNANPQMTEEQVLQQRHAQETQRQQFINEYLDISWNLYKLAQISRKQNLPSLAYNYVQTLRKQLQISSDSDGVKYERFKLDYEELKINLTFNNNPQSLENVIRNFEDILVRRYSQEFQGMQDPWQAAEINRLIGEYYLRTGNLNSSQKYLTNSINLNKKEAKTWLSYAKLNQVVYENRRSEVALQNCLKGYLTNIILDLPRSRLVIPQMMKLLKRKDMNNAQLQPVINFIKTNLDQMPTWIWIFWIPQLLYTFCKYQNPVEYCLAVKALEKLSKQYPQTLYYPIKLKQVNEELSNTQNQYFRMYLKNIQTHCSGQILGYQDKISNELNKVMKMSVEEELYAVLNRILHLSSFFKIENLELEIYQFLNQILDRYLKDEVIQAIPSLQHLKQIFLQDFFNEETKERDITEIIRRLKNLKDFLHRKLCLSEQKSNLELISPYLANFNEKGVELHGQYMVIDTEPLPQNTVYIQKFEPILYRSGALTKKLVIKGSNSRVYGFTISFISTKDECLRHFQDERVLQIKMIMNQIFQKHKETTRRGIKFSVPIKCLLSRCKLTQDDPQLGNLLEIHDYLLQERGFDSDLAFNIQLKKVKQSLAGYAEGSEKTISSLGAERKKQIIEETYNEMKNIYCQPYLLSSFFHRIFYTVDDLFIFKKQFTNYHAVNAFFSYIFTQAENATLNNISFCKTSGRLIFSDAKLSNFLTYMKQHYNSLTTQRNNLQQQTSNLSTTQSQNPAGGPTINPQPSAGINLASLGDSDFEAFEQQEIQKQNTYLPFRLTSNIAEFIGKIGLNGPFAGTITACSMALSKHQEKFLSLIYIMFLDEMNGQREGMIQFINTCCDYLRFKMTSLSQNKKVIQSGVAEPQIPRAGAQNAATGENQQQPMQIDTNEEKKSEWEDTIKIGHYVVPKSQLKFEIEKPYVFEEFNKKVFDLMEVAMDDSRLSQMTNNHWNAWF